MTKNYMGWLNAKSVAELYFDDKEAFNEAMHLLLDLLRTYTTASSLCYALAKCDKYSPLKPLLAIKKPDGELAIYPEAVGKTEADIKEPEEEKRGVYKLSTGTC